MFLLGDTQCPTVLVCRGGLAQNQLALNMELFSCTLNSVLSLRTFVPKPALQCAGHRHFVVSFDFGKCEFSNFVPFKLFLRFFTEVKYT